MNAARRPLARPLIVLRSGLHGIEIRVVGLKATRWRRKDVSKSDFDPSKIDPSRIRFASQDGVAQFEALAREFLPAILGLDFEETMITDESSLSDFCGWRETREEFDAWERKVLNGIEDRYGVRPVDSRVHLVDLFRDVELQRWGSTRQ
jgi:hypothetical protein